MRNCKIGFLAIVLGLSFEACFSSVIIETFSTAVCETADPSKLTFFPYEGDCTRYIQCYNGEGTVMQCLDDLWWHDEIQNCDYPGEYCIWGSYTPTQGTTPGTIGSDPRCVNNGLQYYPHPAFCHRYIECYGGNSYEMACPPSLYFSTLHQECVNPEDSECCVSSEQC